MKTGRFMRGERISAVCSLDRGTRTGSWLRFSGQAVRLEVPALDNCTGPWLRVTRDHVLRRLVDQEAVQKLGDLQLRRADWLADPLRGTSITSAIRRLKDRPLPQDVRKSNIVRKGS